MAIPPRRAATNKKRSEFVDVTTLEQTVFNSADSNAGDVIPTSGSSDLAPSEELDDARSEIEVPHRLFPESSTKERSIPESAQSARGDNPETPRDVLLALTYGLELVQHGALFVAADSHLRLANRTAIEILHKNDGITISRTGLVANRASDTRLLHKLLADAIQFPERGEPVDSPLVLQRKQARHSLIVRVIPGPELDCWPQADNRTVLLKLYDQDLGLVVDERALSSLYGLTRGEAVLAARLAQGRSIEEAAAELFISAHTARTHLKRIFMKTDTHRQTELVVRMLLTVL
jgi:DNA-binding CsgD family transcriptional regulator